MGDFMLYIYEKTIYTSDVENKISARIKTAKEQLKVINTIIPVLRAFEGKKITKRIATAIQKELPGYHVRYRPDYGMYHIDITSNDHLSMSVLIGYASMPRIIMTNVMDYVKCYTLEEDRIRSYERALDKVSGFVARHNRIVKEHNELYNEMSEFEIQYYIGK
jgi:hypothetical protein